MKSIFKRCCLTHTYLSRYVKTSNEDKHHRGAKSCLGKWIPKWRHPLVPDALPYGVGQSGRSEQCGRRSESRTDIPARDALGQEIPVRRHCWIEEQTRKWTQAHHQHQEGQHRQSVSKARAAWEEATGKKIKDGAFRNFLSSMAQDLDV